MLRKRIFHACAKRPPCLELARTGGRYTRLRANPTHDIKWGCRIHTVLAVLPRPTTLGIDQRAINCCADAARNRAEARNLVVAGKTDTRSCKYTCIEATAVALDVSPMSVGLDSKNGPFDLPVSTNLATEKPTTDRERSLGRSNQRQRSRVWHLGRNRSQRRILIPSALIVPPASTAADSEINAHQAKDGDGRKDRHSQIGRA